MIIVLARGTPLDQAHEVLASLASAGVRGRLLECDQRPLIHLIEGPTRAARRVVGAQCVEGLVATSGPRIRREGRRFYPYHFINWSTAALLVLGVLVVLAGFVPPGLGEQIDPHGRLTALGVPWYLRAPSALLGLFPESRTWLGWALLGLIALVVVFAPWLERTFTGRRRRASGADWPRVALVLLALAGWVALTVRGPL